MGWGWTGVLAHEPNPAARCEREKSPESEAGPGEDRDGERDAALSQQP